MSATSRAMGSGFGSLQDVSTVRPQVAPAPEATTPTAVAVILATDTDRKHWNRTISGRLEKHRPLEARVDDQTRMNRALLKVRLGKAALTARVEMTTPGLIAIGALVSSILVSTAGLVWVATSVARDRPVLTALRRK